MSGPVSHAPSPEAPHTIEAATAPERAEHVAALRDLARSQPMSGLVLRVDSESGADDRIRIDVRGNRVDTRIAVNDLGRANELAQRVPDLARALETRGLAPAGTEVRTVTREMRAASDVHAARANDLFVADAMATTSGSSLADAHTDSRSSSRDTWRDDAQFRSQHQGNRQRQRRERPGQGGDHA